MAKKKYIPKEVVEINRMRFNRLKKECEKSIKQNNPEAEKFAEQMVQSYINLGTSISNHYVPKIKDLDKTIKALNREKKKKD